MGKLKKDFKSVEGLEISKALNTPSGLDYRVVRLSSSSAAVIVANVADFSLRLDSDGGDVGSIEKSVLDTIVEWSVKLVTKVIKLATGQCYIVTGVRVRTGKDGKVTSVKGAVSIECGSISW